MCRTLQIRVNTETCISSVQQMNKNSIEFSLSTQTRSVIKLPQAKSLHTSCSLLLILTLHTHYFCYVDTIGEPPGIANALGYLHDYLQQLLERQNNAKTNINTALTIRTQTEASQNYSQSKLTERTQQSSHLIMVYYLYISCVYFYLWTPTYLFQSFPSFLIKRKEKEKEKENK